MLNSDYDLASGNAKLAEGGANAMAFGRKFLANPDLPHRFAENLPLNTDAPRTWYSQGPERYFTYLTAQ